MILSSSTINKESCVLLDVSNYLIDVIIISAPILNSDINAIFCKYVMLFLYI